MNPKRPLHENFRDFMISAETHQSPHNPYVNQFIEVGLNPNEDSDLPFHFERRPEIGEDSNSALLILEKIESISNLSINMVSNISNLDDNPQITKDLELAYSYLREAYIKLSKESR